MAAVDEEMKSHYDLKIYKSLAVSVARVLTYPYLQNQAQVNYQMLLGPPLFLCQTLLILGVSERQTLPRAL